MRCPARFFLVVSLACVALTTARAGRAEATSSPCEQLPNAVVADLGLHVVNAGYQRTVGCYLVLQASMGLYVPWMVNDNVLGLGGGERPPEGIWDAAGFVVRLRSFVFPVGTAPTGFWISPYLQGAYLRGVGEAEQSFAGFGQAEGISVGGTFRIGDPILVALGAGAQLHSAFFDGSSEPPGFALPGPTIDINLAYAF